MTGVQVLLRVGDQYGRHSSGHPDVGIEVMGMRTSLGVDTADSLARSSAVLGRCEGPSALSAALEAKFYSSRTPTQSMDSLPAVGCSCLSPRWGKGPMGVSNNPQGFIAGERLTALKGTM